VEDEKAVDVSNTHFIHAPLQTILGHSNVVVAADWLVKGDRVISGSWDGSALVSDVETGVTVDTLSGQLVFKAPSLP